MTAFAPNSLILYVDDVEASAAFYARILGKGPVQTFEGFAVFKLTASMTLGLQDAHSIEPSAERAFGGMEISWSDVDRVTVDALYTQWSADGVRMALAPTELDFGYTFVALDPDGHRLRVCATDTTGLS